MNLYAESSAVLAWLLGDEGGSEARERLSAAEMVLTSDLTLIEPIGSFIVRRLSGS